LGLFDISLVALSCARLGSCLCRRRLPVCGAVRIGGLEQIEILKFSEQDPNCAFAASCSRMNARRGRRNWMLGIAIMRSRVRGVAATPTAFARHE